MPLAKQSLTERVMQHSVVSASVPGSHSPAPASLAGLVTEQLRRFLDAQIDQLTELSPDLAPLAEAARRSVLDGGKRLRPTFGYWGWRAVQPAGAADEELVLAAVASLELLHACALVHDDVMDASATRRGRPAAHVEFARQHAAAGWPGSAETFGTAGAILLGDLLLSWAGQMLAGAIRALPAGRAAAAEREFDRMRSEVVAGQFLDVLAQSRGRFDPDEALRVIRLKTSMYTVVRPLLLGATAGGAPAQVQAELTDYGNALGEAFQLRDDLLGVFGDPEETGKPAGDDLREGKRTLLVALAVAGAEPGQRQRIEAAVGNAELTEADVVALRQLLAPAAEQVERRIADRAAAAVGQLSPAIRPDAREALAELAEAAAHRRF